MFVQKWDGLGVCFKTGGWETDESTCVFFFLLKDQLVLVPHALLEQYFSS